MKSEINSFWVVFWPWTPLLETLNWSVWSLKWMLLSGIPQSSLGGRSQVAICNSSSLDIRFWKSCILQNPAKGVIIMELNSFLGWLLLHRITSPISSFDTRAIQFNANFLVLNNDQAPLAIVILKGRSLSLGKPIAGTERSKETNFNFGEKWNLCKRIEFKEHWRENYVSRKLRKLHTSALQSHFCKQRAED